MAKVTVCDLCKKAILDESDYSICIAHETDKEQTHSGEVCTECFETLQNWLLAPAAEALRDPKKSLSDGLHEMVRPNVEVVEDAEPAEIKALEPPRSSDKRGKIEEGELNVVKSRFDKRKANKVVSETKGKCDHHFKSFEDGKIICSPAPPGFQGELATFRGCGKILTETEI